jgi:phytoene synthase
MTALGDAAFAHCRRLIAQTDKVRYWATLYAPEERRDGLFALYAFDLQLAAIRDRVRDPMAGEIRLQWWREALEGKRGVEAGANPVAAALLAILRHHSAAPPLLLRLIEARRFDVYDEPMETIAELDAYARATAGAVFQIGAQLLGATDAWSEEIADHAGVAQTYLQIVRAPARERLYFPTEVLTHHGAARDAVGTLELRAALAEMRLRGRRHLDLAASLRPDVPQQILPVLLPAAVIRPTLAKMEKRSYDPTQPVRLSPLHRQWLVWRAARDPERIFR